MAVAAMLMWFFRDPERFPPEKDGVILFSLDSVHSIFISLRRVNNGVDSAG